MQAIMSPVPSENLCIRVIDPTQDPTKKLGDLVPCSADAMILDSAIGRVPLRYPGVLPRVLLRQ
jgi:hypothetical protein